MFEGKNLFISKVKRIKRKASLSGIYYIEDDKITSEANIKTAPYLLLFEGVGGKCVLPLGDAGDFYVTSSLKENNKLKIEGSLFLKNDNTQIKTNRINQILNRDFRNAIKKTLNRNENIDIELTIKAQNLNTEE